MSNVVKVVKNDCYNCIHKRNIPGDAHISCVNPDHDMKGHPHGVKNGWFIYPSLFDPTWMTVKCKNFEPINDESVAVSSAVNPEM